MGKNSDKSSKKKLKKVNIHEGRARVLLQTLRDRDAEVIIDLDLTGESRKTIYGKTKHAEHSLKDLLKVVWSKELHERAYASTHAINEYFRSDFEIHSRNRRSTNISHHPAQKNVILMVTGIFPREKPIEHRDMKQEIFFSGHLSESTNLLAAFPTFRRSIKQKIDEFLERLRDERKSFPYQHLRHQTGLRCHRHKEIEKSIFQFLKDTDDETLVFIRKNLLRVMNAYSMHLQDLNDQKVGFEKPDKGKVLKDRLLYDELSIGEQVEISEKEKSHIKEIGFQNVFSDADQWFDQYRFKKMIYWNETVQKLSINDWPKFYLEQILLAYVELNAVCERILEIRQSLFTEVGFRVNFSKDGVVSSFANEYETLEEVAKVLSNYEYESNAFVRKIREDGHILRAPLRCLPQKLLDEELFPDHLYYSRIEKLLWEYLLYRLCDCCELNKKHLIDL